MSSGIYKIQNKINQHSYIGSSLRIEIRIGNHKSSLRNNRHHNRHLQNAWNLYGEDAFSFEVLESVPGPERLKREQIYLDSYKPQYNISTSATAPMENRKHSEETKAKMRGRESIKGADHYWYGTKWSPDLREKILKKRIGSKRSAETKKKMSDTAKRLNRFKDIAPHIESIKKKVIDSNGNQFNSMKETAKFHGISVQTVCDILKGRHFQTRKKVSFKYV